MVFVDFGTILVCPKMQDIIVNMKFDIQNNGDVNNNFFDKNCDPNFLEKKKKRKI